jgi:phage tail tube protein FII
MFKLSKSNKVLKAVNPVTPIDRANSIVSSATNMFHTAINQVNQANSILQDYYKDKETELEILKAQMEEAVREIEVTKIATTKNDELKSKLSQFI